MGTDRLRVELTMETSLLTSAIQQCLAGNPRLDVKVQPSGGDGTEPGAPTSTDELRTVRIGLLDDPLRFALQAGGRDWVLEYGSLDGLAQVLADLENPDVLDTGRS